MSSSSAPSSASSACTTAYHSQSSQLDLGLDSTAGSSSVCSISSAASLSGDIAPPSIVGTIAADTVAPTTAVGLAMPIELEACGGRQCSIGELTGDSVAECNQAAGDERQAVGLASAAAMIACPEIVTLSTVASNPTLVDENYSIAQQQQQEFLQMEQTCQQEEQQTRVVEVLEVEVVEPGVVAAEFHAAAAAAASTPTVRDAPVEAPLQTQIFSAYDVMPSFAPSDATSGPTLESSSFCCGSGGGGRPERSNSCSQAELLAVSARASATSAAAQQQHLASSQSIGGASSSPVASNAAVSGSVSHDNLAAAVDDVEQQIELAREPPQQQQHQQPSSSSHATTPPIACQRLATAAAIHDGTPPLDISASLSIVHGHELISASLSPPRSHLVDHFENHHPLESHHNLNQTLPESSLGQNQQQQQAFKQPSSSCAVAPVAAPNSSNSSSRFFTSKLNTGSLWSLLSVGSSTSMSAINEIHSTTSTDIEAHDREGQPLQSQVPDKQQQQPVALHDQSSAGKQLREFTARSANFFNQLTKPKSGSVQANSQHQPASSAAAPMLSSGSISFDHSPRSKSLQQQQHDPAAEMQRQQQQQKGPKYRFSVKYIGSAMLHKNFTLPMLEWIVKDVKRQTGASRGGGAPAAGQRQFTIPVREIMLEIQHSSRWPQQLQLTAISCRDGHAIFVHPMHCVSKYAQLQHDPSAFAYIIRDSKEAPSFCHVFQAKSAQRVHEIFSAIREVTTRNQLLMGSGGGGAMPMHSMLNSQVNASINRLQKSASTEGHWRSLLGPSSSSSLSPSGGTIAPVATTLPEQIKQVENLSTSGRVVTGEPAQQQQQQQLQTTAQAKTSAQEASERDSDQQLSLQFENSYQFEVMFVKRVKLQCRRVPPSFVDDALETLKTFEAPKTTQMKGGVTKRIISASVDERQEYDEHCQSPTPDVQATPQQKAGGFSSGAQKAVKPAADSTKETDLAKEDDNQRRGSSVSLKQQPGQGVAAGSPTRSHSRNSESRSCQQSPVKVAASGKHLDSTCSLAATSSTYDFSPYNTITSSDLNERIAAIPVVSGSSASLDHETRQRLARQVRETIMATAATIQPHRRGPERSEFTAGSKCPPQTRRASASPSLDNTNAPIKQLAAAAGGTTAATAAAANNFDLFRRASARQVVKNRTMLLVIGKDELAAISIDKHQMLFSKSFNSIVHCLQGIKNKDHFGLICRDSGKINPQAETYAGFVFKCQSDKVVREIMGALKQVIYSSQHNYHGYYSPYNPLNSLAHSVGQSSIQSAFNANTSKQRQEQQKSSSSSSSPKFEQRRVQQQQQAVGTTSSAGSSPAKATRESVRTDHEFKDQQQQQQQMSLAAKRGFANPLEIDEPPAGTATATHLLKVSAPGPPPTAPALTSCSAGGGGGGGGGGPMQAAFAAATVSPLLQTTTSAIVKNPIQSMFCDDCPLYWYHRLCCDIESLPAEASKAIILRRIDSSLSEREQDEIFTKFSEFKVASCDEHNEIFMSILRHLGERKQLRHSQSQAHASALTKKASLIRKQSSDVIGAGGSVQRQSSLAALVTSRSSSALPKSQAFGAVNAISGGGCLSSTAGRQLSLATDASSHHSQSNEPMSISAASNNQQQHARGHQRSGSSSGSLAFITSGVCQQEQQPHTSDTSSLLAFEQNLIRAKNSISSSIENMLKRRPSLTMDDGLGESTTSDKSLMRSSSFRGSPSNRSSTTKTMTATNHEPANDSSLDYNFQDQEAQNNLRRSQSTSDYSQQAAGFDSSRNPAAAAASWRDSLSRTLNTEDLTNPLVSFFKRRGSLVTAAAAQDHTNEHHQQASNQNRQELDSKRTSTESLPHATSGQQSPMRSYQTAIQSHLTTRLRPASFASDSNSAHSTSGHSSPSNLLSGSFWKKSIFDKIQKTSPTQQQQQQPPSRAEATCGLVGDKTKDCNQQVQQNVRKTRDELRALWRKAILEQITLLKMDKQNQKLLSSRQEECRQKQQQDERVENLSQLKQQQQQPVDEEPPSNEVQRMKLNYRDVPYAKDAFQVWSQLLRQDPTKKVQFVEVTRHVRLGVPKQSRGEVWMFLMNQYQLRHGTSFQPASESEFRGNANQTYRSLLSQLSTQQHEIFVDIGRTFPSHPYYSRYLSIGQLSLFNLLKAYSLLDPEVGYCQGLSFVAGILMLHVDSEDEAFELMRHLMFNFGLRKQYLPSMDALHLQLYQMTRLLRDYEYVIFDHFDRNDISPSLYAAPWFLTLFASQFPLGFVARLLDLIYLIGIEAIFRVSLILLAFHRSRLLECSSLELTMDFMRTELVKIDDASLAKIFDDSLGLDLRNKLIEYEIEYSFYCADDKARSMSSSSSSNGANYNNQHHHHYHHHNAHIRHLPSADSQTQSSTINLDMKPENLKHDQEQLDNPTISMNDEHDDSKTTTTTTTTTDATVELTSEVADATATVIIQHLLANNHLRTLRSNYSY